MGSCRKFAGLLIRDTTNPPVDDDSHPEIPTNFPFRARPRFSAAKGVKASLKLDRLEGDKPFRSFRSGLFLLGVAPATCCHFLLELMTAWFGLQINGCTRDR